MADDLVLDRSFEGEPGEVVRLSPLVRRLTAGNPGPFTFKGTNSYIVGRGRVAVIDPGPDDDAHLAALLAALDGDVVTDILVTHTHRDHVGALAALARATGARVAGCGPHASARALAAGETNPLDASADRDYRPDLPMADGEAILGPGWTLGAVATPGHTANHLAFALPEENALFSGDHVMVWSTTIVAPPDGSMADYMASLRRLQDRTDSIYHPGHGGPVRDPARHVAGLLSHRRAREAQILERLAAGDRTIPEIVRAAYAGLDPRLFGAAGLSVLAHLEDLVARGRVRTDGAPSPEGEYAPA